MDGTTDESEPPVRRIEIANTWDGRPVASGEHAHLALRIDERRLVVEVDAPLHGDPPPPAPPGRLDGLWDHEVVELFLVGEDGRYLELELGPHGHWLALTLRPVRERLDERVELEFDWSHTPEGRWRGRARLAARWVPQPIARWNAFAIHGAADARRHLAASPVTGAAPDFHRIDAFPRWPPLSARRGSRRSPPHP